MKQFNINIGIVVMYDQFKYNNSANKNYLSENLIY